MDSPDALCPAPLRGPSTRRTVLRAVAWGVPVAAVASAAPAFATSGSPDFEVEIETGSAVTFHGGVIDLRVTVINISDSPLRGGSTLTLPAPAGTVLTNSDVSGSPWAFLPPAVWTLPVDLLSWTQIDLELTFEVQSEDPIALTFAATLTPAGGQSVASNTEQVQVELV